MLAFFLAMALLGAVVVAGSLFVALVAVLRREADLVVQVTRLEEEADANQDLANDRARRLSRTRTPLIPAQRKAAS